MNTVTFYFLFITKFGLAILMKLTDVRDLAYYEIVELRHVDLRGRIRRDISTYVPEDDSHLEETAYSFFGHGRYFNIQIYKNRFLIPESFSTIYQDVDGSYISHGSVEHCYYHGYLKGRAKSFAAVNTCYGFKGVLTDEDEVEFQIEPYQEHIKNENFNSSWNSSRHILFKSKDVINTDASSYSCGINKTHHHYTNHDRDYLKGGSNSLLRHSTAEHHRLRRSTADMKYIEVVIVLDNLKYKAHGEDLNATTHRAFEIFNMVDYVYKSINTRVAVVHMVVWNVLNMATVSSNSGETLIEFEKYTRDVLHDELNLMFDNAQLITTQNWANLVGLAGIGVMCTLTSSAINRDHSRGPAGSANTIAHEIGHNIGFLHDQDECVCDKRPCVMERIVPWKPCQSFTDCSRVVFEKRLKTGELPCLLDYPDKLYGKPRCGNGYLEEGEQCDCGSSIECKKLNLDKCCNSTTCELLAHAQCANGACCNNCKFKRRGELCRAKTSQDCDLEEFCTGRSSMCPKNFHVQDGSPCNGDRAYCYQGTCKTHDTQCEMLWGPNAKKAADQCFSINMRGNSWANCGKNLRGDYIPCERKDTLCGNLKCAEKSPDKPLPNFPIIGDDRQKVIQRIGRLSCVLGKTTVSRDLQDPTMTNAGVKCGNQSVCIDHKCVNISSLVYIKQCSQSCMDAGGVCNNNGNCHCPKGLACPYCKLAGPGGSADSGQGCILHDNCEDCFNTLTKALMIIFLLVVPLVAICISYRYRFWIRGKCHGIRRGKAGNEMSSAGAWTSDDDMTIEKHNQRTFRPTRPAPPPPPPPHKIPPVTTRHY